MFFQSKTNQRRVLYILDMIVLSISYYLALVFRYKSIGNIAAWQRQLYIILLFLFYLGYTLIFFLSPKNRKRLRPKSLRKRNRLHRKSTQNPRTKR